MKRLSILLVAFLVLVFGSAVFAGKPAPTIPDIRGKWQGTLNDIWRTTGGEIGTRSSADGLYLEFQILEQSGALFVGTLTVLLDYDGDFTTPPDGWVIHHISGYLQPVGNSYEIYFGGGQTPIQGIQTVPPTLGTLASLQGQARLSADGARLTGNLVKARHYPDDIIPVNPSVSATSFEVQKVAAP